MKAGARVAKWLGLKQGHCRHGSKDDLHAERGVVGLLVAQGQAGVPCPCACTPSPHLDHRDLIGLALGAVDLLGDDLGGADLKLITLPPHVLDQDAQVQRPAAADTERLCALTRLDTQREVALQLTGCAEVRGRVRGGSQQQWTEAFHTACSNYLLLC